MKPDPKPMSALVLDNISHAFGAHQILKSVSVEVAEGDVACLLGPSGCGKTTLLRIAAGLESLQSGRVSIDGTVMAENPKTDIPPERRNMGLMFQDFALFPHLNVYENITFGLKNKSSDRHQWVQDAVVRMGMKDYTRHYPHELSGGQQQRAALLRALAPEPSVLLLDEPFSGLDITRRAQVREQTLELLKETGHTALMVSHDPEEAMFMADRLLIMDSGNLAQSGTPTEVYQNPGSAFVAALFGESNILRGLCTSDGVLATPLGDMEMPKMRTGETADVIIRAEGISVETETVNNLSYPTQATVTGAFPIGRSTHLRLNLDNGTQIRARVNGILTPDVGSKTGITIDPDQLFIFPQG